jgi:hypothetical protein
MKAQKVIRSKALLNPNLGATGGWVVKATPRLLYLRESAPVPFV